MSQQIHFPTLLAKVTEGESLSSQEAEAAFDLFMDGSATPVQMAADLPEKYRGHAAFRFIQDVPVDWETTRVLHARIGDYVTTVRRDRHSEDWYLGSVTDENGRTLTASLSFLDRNRKYRAEIYRDAPDSHYRTNPLPIRIESRTVTAAESLTLELAPGGGTAIRFTPLP